MKALRVLFAALPALYASALILMPGCASVQRGITDFSDGFARSWNASQAAIHAPPAVAYARDVGDCYVPDIQDQLDDIAYNQREAARDASERFDTLQRQHQNERWNEAMEPWGYGL